MYFMEMGTRGHVIKHGKQSGNAESLELFVFGCLRAPETEGFFVLRAIRIFLSVTTKQQDIRKKETKMNSLVIILIAMAVLVAGYVFYGRWLAKKWGIDEKAKTPAFTHEDGEDFVPSSKFTVFSHQFSSIAGAGPVTGPILASVFGWVPVLLWLLIGGLFFGAVQDFGALYASVKNEGKSMGMIIEKYIGKFGRKIFLLFCWLFTLIVIAAFADMVAGTFNAYTVNADGATVLSAAAKTNGSAGMVSIMFMVFAVVFGLIQKKLNLSGWKEAVLGIVFIIAAFAVGMFFPLEFNKDVWSYITFVYIFFAAVMPMWLMKQPRDYMTTFMFICMIVGAAVGLVVAHPSMNLPVYTGFNNAKLGTMFPILFVTVACGAVSGFHSLVSSGTSSKTVENEKDMLKVGYGAMVLESLLAVLALCVAGAAATNGALPAKTPFAIFSSGVAGFFEMFGVPVHFATVFMTMCVSALALTSLDAVARIGRMSFQELFSVDDMEHAEGWRKLLCNTYFSTIVTLVCGFILTKIGYANIWPLFGSANQLLSALVILTLCVFLKVTGRSNKMLFPPLIIMLCVTFTALVQRTIAMVKAIKLAASVTIPAGQTSWGSVFIANGLQLIIAILLIVLGVIIVVNSVKSYAKSEKNSEKTAA